MKKIARDTSKYLSINLIVQLFSILRGTIVARFLGPAYYGLWNFLQIILDYSPYCGLGVVTAMDREYPYYIGRNELKEANTLKDTAFSFNMIINIILSLILFGIAVFLRTKIAREVTIGLMVISSVSFLQQISMFYRELARLEKRIDNVNIMLLLFSGINCLFSIMLVRRFSIYALYIAIVPAYCIALFYIIYKTRNKFRFKIEYERLKPLIKLGLVLTIIPLFTIILQSVDKLMILKFLNLAYLGLYGLGSLFAGLLLYLPIAYQFISYPYLLEGHGRRDDARELLGSYVLRPTFALAGLLAFIIGIMFILSEPVITYILPKYLDGLMTMKILLVGEFFFSLIYLPVNFLVAVNKQTRIIMIQLGCIFFEIALNCALIKTGLSINAVALVRSATYFLLGSWMLGYAIFYCLKKISSTIGYFMKIYTSLAYVLIIIFILSSPWIKQFMPSSNLLVYSLIKLTIFSLFCAPPLYYLNRHYRLRVY